MRHHIVVLAAHIEVEQIVGLQAELRIGLRIDLQRETEFVELIDVGRADIGGQGREDVADRNPQGLRSVAIDRKADVRRARAKGREDRAATAGRPWPA